MHLYVADRNADKLLGQNSGGIRDNIVKTIALLMTRKCKNNKVLMEFIKIDSNHVI